jgi:hypothetical protein
MTIVPTADVDTDRHKVALWRLAAVAQYLYDTMNGDAESDRNRPDPLPPYAMEKVRDAQAAIDEAIGRGQRTRRVTIGGELDLNEDWKHIHALSAEGDDE